jgi:hypothetical protein
VHGVCSSPKRRQSWLKEVQQSASYEAGDARSSALMLILDVKTRWSSTYEMLCEWYSVHTYTYLTATGRALKYREAINTFIYRHEEFIPYRITQDDWRAIDMVTKWLKSFRDATHPMLEAIEESMVAVRDDDDAELPNVIRIAAQAALLLIDKYSIFTNDCELYQIAIGTSLKPFMQAFELI